MARALIVGCGCRGRELGRRLAAEGWAVRGTSRSEAGLEAVSAAGIEAAPADPDRPGEILELLADATVVYYLMGSMGPDAPRAPDVHGSRLERLLEKVVDTPVRGFVYEGAGTTAAALLEEGRAVVERASATWSIPVAVLESDPEDHGEWVEEAAAAALSVLER